VDRVLLIGARMASEIPETISPDSLMPSLPLVVGKTLNALMLDPVERDLHQTERINALLAWGRQEFGEAFVSGARDALGMREVKTLFIRPSVDLGRLACQVFHQTPPKTTPQIRWLLSRVADEANSPQGESDFLSFLLFDREYTGVVEDIGFLDAQRMEDEIVAFLES